MDVEEALAFTDALIFTKTGKHLNTLQAAVFRGTWLSQKYEQIAQTCYCSEDYVKTVGATLWKLLSEGLEEKVSKKTFRAALERRKRYSTSITGSSLPETQSFRVQSAGIEHNTDSEVAPLLHSKVFVYHGSQESDLNIAREFEQALRASGHQTLMAQEIMRSQENWSQHFDAELKRCDYWVLLLSEQSAISEIVTEIVRWTKTQISHSQQKSPVIIPIWVDSQSSSLNYDLYGYLNQIPQHEWRSPADTPTTLQKVLSRIAEHQLPTSEFTVAVPTTLQKITIDSPPSPVAAPELPAGQVDLASLFYIERPPIESRSYEMISHRGALIRIKAPRQMGKTSLMARILHHATKQGYHTLPLSFQFADSSVFQDLDRFLRWFCVNVGLGLELPNRLAEYWDEMFGSKISCKVYFEKYILAQLSQPLVLGLDEVDRIFLYPEIADDFFGLLRAWHEEAKNREIWHKLRLVIAHSTEVYIPLNIHQSPFNVGLSIELPEFTSEQVQDLAQRHGLHWDITQVVQLMAMVGGHPYLVRVALYYIAQQDLTLAQLLRTAPTETGPYSDHLRRHLWNIQQQPELAAAMKSIVAASHPIRLAALQAFKLYSMGLVHQQGNEVTPRCNLYRQYFYKHLTSAENEIYRGL